MNRQNKKTQLKPRTVTEWRERVFQRLDQVLGTGASKRHHEMGGLGVVGQDKTDGWRRLDPVAVANGIAAEEVGRCQVEDEPGPMPREHVPIVIDGQHLAALEQALGCAIKVTP